jgi:hypothetical protein
LNFHDLGIHEYLCKGQLLDIYYRTKMFTFEILELDATETWGQVLPSTIIQFEPIQVIVCILISIDNAQSLFVLLSE